MIRLNRQKVRRVAAGVDWGLNDPGVIVVGGLDNDGRLWCVSEVYHTGQTIDWWIARAKAVRDWFGIEMFVCDPSEPAYILQFQRAGLPACKAMNAVLPGIDLVTRRLKADRGGRPRVYVYRGLDLVRDQELVKDRRPASLEEEMTAYIWKTGPGGIRKGEEPLDKDNHALDALRYLVAYFDFSPKSGKPAAGGRRPEVDGFRAR